MPPVALGESVAQRRVIDSIIAQTMKDWEIVLMDNGSTDETVDLARDYQRRLGERFVYAFQPNAGPGAARNHGIDRCHGRFVTFLDSDDEFLPTKLARQVELLERAPGPGLVYCDSAFVDLDGTRHESVFDEKTELARALSYEELAPGLQSHSAKSRQPTRICAAATNRTDELGYGFSN